MKQIDGIYSGTKKCTFDALGQKKHWSNHLYQFSRGKLTLFETAKSSTKKTWIFHLFSSTDLECLHEVFGAWPQRAVWRPGDFWPKLYCLWWCILRYVFMLDENQIGITIIINCLWLLFDLFFLHVLHPGWGNRCCSKLTEPGWTWVAVPSIG